MQGSSTDLVPVPLASKASYEHDEQGSLEDDMESEDEALLKKEWLIENSLARQQKKAKVACPLRPPGTLRLQPASSPVGLRFVPIPAAVRQENLQEETRWTIPLQKNQISYQLVHWEWESPPTLSKVGIEPQQTPSLPPQQKKPIDVPSRHPTTLEDIIFLLE